MKDVTANKRKMKDLEDNLLYRLTSTDGSLVDDDDLVDVLNVTKVIEILFNVLTYTYRVAQNKTVKVKSAILKCGRRRGAHLFLVTGCTAHHTCNECFAKYLNSSHSSLQFAEKSVHQHQH